jgi:TPR repeat protein
LGLYHLGREEYNTARNLFNLATQQDHPEALFIVGFSYEDNDQFDIAEEYYERAATLGHAGAQYHLALLIEDNERMLGYLEQAAAQDHADALYYLSTLYFNSDVVHQDLNMAREYFQRAAAQGHSEAWDALESFPWNTDIDQVHE